VRSALILANAQVAAARLSTNITVRLGNASPEDLEAAKHNLREAAKEARELGERLELAALELMSKETKRDDAA
jgi:hypothetical protein